MNTLKETRPVANKEHVCNWCGSKIVKGEKYNRQTILFDGSIYDWVSHVDCLELTGLLNMFDYDYGDGINEDIFKECVEEYIYEHHYDNDLDDIEKIQKIKKSLDLPQGVTFIFRSGGKKL